MGTPIDRTAKSALDSNLVNGVTSDAPKVKANNDVLYNYADALNNGLDAHAGAATLPHADGSVTGPKIKDGTITEPKYATGSVSSRAIANGAVGPSQLQTGLAATVDVNAQFAKRGIDVTSAPYNADPSGAMDSTAAIQAAYTAAAGKTLFFPSGTYKTTALITAVDNVNIIGDNATIKGNGTFICIAPGNHNYFEGITFDGYTIAVNGQGKSNVSFDRCKFNDMKNVGIYYYGCNTSFVTKCYFNNIIKDSINIDNDAYNILIEGNTFTNPLEYAGYSTSQISAHVNCLNGSDIRVIGNKVFNNGGQGIIFSFNNSSNKGTSFSKAIGNHCQGNGQEGITSFGGTGKYAHDNIIEGNTCRFNRFHQIEIWQSDRTIAIGNIVEEAPVYGNIGAITIFSSNHSKATNNTIYNASNNGIAVLFGSKKCSVSNNNIHNTNGKNNAAATAGQGILLDNNGGTQPTEITIVNNIIESDNGFTALKSGVYSTVTANAGNTIEGNRAFNYQFSVAGFALTTCWNKFSSIPTSGTFTVYDYVINVLPTVLGTAGSRYKVLGWHRLTTGSGHVLNTDWSEDRALTGT